LPVLENLSHKMDSLAKIGPSVHHHAAGRQSMLSVLLFPTLQSSHATCTFVGSSRRAQFLLIGSTWSQWKQQTPSAFPRPQTSHRSTPPLRCAFALNVLYLSRRQAALL
jgi:hypothetical protein